MKAMILAAGLGIRLRPLTENIPKALIKIGNTPLLEYVIKKLLHHGFNDIIINVHHHPDMIINFLEKNKNFGANISISDERDILLDTGGGLKKAAPFFSGKESFLLYNCDIVTDLNLLTLYKYHLEQSALCTLAVRDRETSRYFVFDDDNTLCGWWNKATGEKKSVRWGGSKFRAMAFSGIQIINPSVLDLFPDKKVFSLVEFYLLIARDHKIGGYDHTETRWADIGNSDTLEQMQMIRPEDF
jgi:Nucleoside-diphosphate-sugar pyrophosphorylase involved in lipopolysaccharide biosynthesis/translation initiation factor 2B, gamma/epsilon subunits (eIF-2Bgamma/eIF-2Bepsilon)